MRRGAAVALVGVLLLAGCGSGSGGKGAPAPSATPPSAVAVASVDSPSGSLLDQLKDLGYQRTSTEEWKPTSDTSLPTVHTTEASPGAPGKPAVSQVSYDNGVAGYAKVWCVPTAQYAFNPAYVIDQAEVAKQLLESGQAQPGPGPNATKTMVSVDGSVTCYLK